MFLYFSLCPPPPKTHTHTHPTQNCVYQFFLHLYAIQFHLKMVPDRIVWHKRITQIDDRSLLHDKKKMPYLFRVETLLTNTSILYCCNNYEKNVFVVIEHRLEMRILKLALQKHSDCWDSWGQFVSENVQFWGNIAFGQSHSTPNVCLSHRLAHFGSQRRQTQSHSANVSVSNVFILRP